LGVASWAVLALFATGASGGQDDAAVKEFGTSCGEPINTGFFFYGYRYVEPPYVIERRGLAICINGHLVRPGREWPPYDYAVNEDPGPPPPGVSLDDNPPPGTDHRDRYWSRKTRYIKQHHSREEATRLIAQLYRDSGAYRAVTVDRERPEMIVVTDRDGDTYRISLRVAPRESITREGALWEAEEGRKYYEAPFRCNTIFIKSVRGGETGLDEERRDRALEALITPVSPEERMRLLLDDTFFLELANEEERAYVRDFRPPKEFIERAKRTLAKEGEEGDQPPPVEPAPTAEVAARSEPRDPEEVARDVRLIERLQEREEWKLRPAPARLPEAHAGEIVVRAEWIVAGTWGVAAVAFMAWRSARKAS
jgi:hypothetical protein